ncbi:MAG: hypothetical protein QXF44_03455 [Candidatus Bathyarchaeia archaeon]
MSNKHRRQSYEHIFLKNTTSLKPEASIDILTKIFGEDADVIRKVILKNFCPKLD